MLEMFAILRRRGLLTANHPIEPDFRVQVNIQFVHIDRHLVRRQLADQPLDLRHFSTFRHFRPRAANRRLGCSTASAKIRSWIRRRLSAGCNKKATRRDITVDRATTILVGPKSEMAPARFSFVTSFAAISFETIPMAVFPSSCGTDNRVIR